MLFVYDIVLNWCNDVIYDFFEWEKKDKIDHIKRIILVKSSMNTLFDFLNYEIEIDKDFISKIHNLSESYQKKAIRKIPYAFIITDGITSIAIKTDKFGKVLFKSKLLLEEEDEVICLSSRLKETSLNYKKGKRVKAKSNLTRKEKELKDFLLFEFDKLRKSKDNDIILYLYSEYYSNQISNSEKAYNLLVESLDNINDKHLVLYKIFNMLKSEVY